ncbi:MAG: excisionase [Thermoplasmata archaeon]|nr:excisionase [Thermoplasmata archaeon]
MLYDLMHKNTVVARIDIHESGAIDEIVSVTSPAHLPIGTTLDGILDKDELEDWWIGRSIPASRTGIRDFLEISGIRDTTSMLTRSMGLSLSDQYWVKPVDQDISWERINFFDNPFSADVGNLLFGRPITGNFDFSSPDNTSDGILRKRWAIVDGKRCLIKSGNPPYYQEPFNEVIATMLMESLGMECVHYNLEWVDRIPCSVCDDFVDRDTELVTAGRLTLNTEDNRPVSGLDKFRTQCRKLDLNVDPFLDRMALADFVMMNTDRHLGNYGLLRRADTLEWIGPAPVYDTGTSLMCKSTTEYIESIIGMSSDVPKVPSIDSLGSLDWVDMDAMRGIMPAVERMLLDAVDEVPDYGMTPGRADALISLLNERMDLVEKAVAPSSRPLRRTCRPSSSGGRRSS